MGLEQDAPARLGLGCDGFRLAEGRQGFVQRDVEGHRHEAEVVFVLLDHRRRLAAVGQQFQFVNQTGRTLLVDRWGQALRGLDMIGQHVGGAQQGLDRHRVARLATGAQLVHQRFEDVGETDQSLQTKRPRPTLHRVNGAEDGVDGFKVGLTLFQQHQLRFQFREQFVAFLEEGGFDGFEGVHGLRPIDL